VRRLYRPTRTGTRTYTGHDDDLLLKIGYSNKIKATPTVVVVVMAVIALVTLSRAVANNPPQRDCHQRLWGGRPPAND
jgi:hypothetical protein